MTVHSFTARNLSDALRLVRESLGPDACVLETRPAGSAWLRWLVGEQIEVLASCDVHVPSRLDDATHELTKPPQTRTSTSEPAELFDYRRHYREALKSRASLESSIVEQLSAPDS